MINQKSVSSIEQSVFTNDFIKPLYDSYCFANLPQTIVNLFSGQHEEGLPADVLGHLSRKYTKVVFILLDGFGWNLFEKYQNKYPFLKRILEKGVVSKLTSQFPSTTASQLTCFYTGLPTCRSGVYEWFYYEPRLDAIIAPLTFSFTGKLEPETLRKAKILPKNIYPSQTFHRVLKKNSVRSYYFNYSEIINSTYSTYITRGATRVPYKTLPEALVNLKNLLLSEKRPSFFSLYFDKIDAISHRYGPDSPQVEAELDILMTALENAFYQNLVDKTDDTLLIVTADHGLTKIYPEKTYYLNKRLRKIKKYLKKNKKGKLLVPAGSTRDMFLYVKDELLGEAYCYLKTRLKKIAAVYKTADLIKAGIFGRSKPSRLFMKRVGNLVILPYDGNSVWWYEKGIFEVKHRGHHGGLTKDEMEIPLLLYSFR
jgi:predicted AlkP superfamily pyrophosphatase or phosphodiesterase